MTDLSQEWEEYVDSPVLRSEGFRGDGINGLQNVFVFNPIKEDFFFYRLEDFVQRPLYCTMNRAMTAAERKTFKVWGLIEVAFFSLVEKGEC